MVEVSAFSDIVVEVNVSTWPRVAMAESKRAHIACMIILLCQILQIVESEYHEVSESATRLR